MTSTKIADVPTEKLEPRFAVPEEYIGRLGIWTMEPRGQEPITWLVKIIGAQKRWERMDLLVETNTGDQFWTSTKTVKIIRGEK